MSQTCQACILGVLNSLGLNAHDVGDLADVVDVQLSGCWNTMAWKKTLRCCCSTSTAGKLEIMHSHSCAQDDRAGLLCRGASPFS